MSTTAAPTTIAEQRVLLRSVTWETYERLLAETPESVGTRFTYDGGLLEIMVVSAEHEDPNRTLAALAEAVAIEISKDFRRCGSTTFKRPDLQKGFEPDSCYYFEHVLEVRGKKKLDLARDPAPELVIEVDITHSSLDRLAIFAAVGVAEVWRYDGEQVLMYRLREDGYAPIEQSVVLPPLTARQATLFLQQSAEISAVDWYTNVRDWVRANR